MYVLCLFSVAVAGQVRSGDVPPEMRMQRVRGFPGRGMGGGGTERPRHARLWFGTADHSGRSCPLAGRASCAGCCCSVAKLCLTVCDRRDCSMPGFPVLHYLLEFELQEMFIVLEIYTYKVVAVLSLSCV